jgi:methylenetetrahydrofolate--tRNA-(uracil-5-)-methyltransferase
MIQSEQLRIIRTIPGLENAHVERYGSVHRNTFINSPNVLDMHLRSRIDPDLWFAGQITGVEGYVESAACGLLVALLIDDVYNNRSPRLPPETTALGSLARYLSASRADFQPTNITFALFPALAPSERKRSRAERSEAMATRALDTLRLWWLQRRGEHETDSTRSSNIDGEFEL